MINNDALSGGLDFIVMIACVFGAMSRFWGLMRSRSLPLCACMQRSPRGSPSSPLSRVYPVISGPAEMRNYSGVVSRRVLRPIYRVDLSVGAFCARPPMSVSSMGFSAFSGRGSISPPSFL
ncbi:hypothetical protein NDU88_005644 [Pleurodeles waltl]|uniref:Secreted protein n=1 Tax=Pleurodeles waltl TaxID=8319 RepID=A0AAV7QHQ9_PLEWA|nr:hypothetical protein NDU88_005644 [Pleurodeles waltl]